MPASTAKPRRILVLEAGGIGDAVMATPALAALRSRFQDASVTVVTAPRAADIVRAASPDFEVAALRLGRPVAQLADALRLAAQARRERFDLLVDLSSIESARAERRRRLFVGLLGVRPALGRSTDGRGGFFDYAATESLTSEQHEVDRKLRVLAPLGISVERPWLALAVPEDAKERAARTLAGAGVGSGTPVVGVNPGAFRPSRRWPVEHFAGLAEELTGPDGPALLVTGGPGEEPLAEEVAAAARGPCVISVGRPLLELAALIARCAVFVTNDTGAMHIAASQDAPTVALFGQTNVHRYRPYMAPSRCAVFKQPASACTAASFASENEECFRHRCEPCVCMSGIAFDEVIAAARRLLAEVRR